MPNDMKPDTLNKTALALLTLAAPASAAIEDVPCSIIKALYDAIFLSIGPTLVGIMFLYGAGKYVYSADDPGGRKQGKEMCIHAIIGGVIITMVDGVKTAMGALLVCL